MNEDESRRYDEAMRKGRYFDGLDIVLKAQAREEGRGTSEEEVYGRLFEKAFPCRAVARDEDK